MLTVLVVVWCSWCGGGDSWPRIFTMPALPPPRALLLLLTLLGAAAAADHESSPAAHHPRLYFSAADLPHLRAKASSRFFSGVLRQYEAALQHKLNYSAGGVLQDVGAGARARRWRRRCCCCCRLPLAPQINIRLRAVPFSRHRPRSPGTEHRAGRPPQTHRRTSRTTTAAAPGTSWPPRSTWRATPSTPPGGGQLYQISRYCRSAAPTLPGQQAF